MPVLTAIDLLGIQDFVFGSRRLRDVVGASLLVSDACAPNGRSPIARLPADQRLITAGGNALLRFGDGTAARDFAAEYTRWLHDHAPGLEAVVVHRPYRDGELAPAILALQVELARAKTERLPTVPLLGLSVTETCHETGRPARKVVSFGGQDFPVSRTTEAVRAAWKDPQGRDRWKPHTPEALAAQGYQLVRPPELDDLGRTQGDTSLLAVVHIDGNRIGHGITGWLEERVEERCADEALWTRFGRLSRSLDALAECVMHQVMRRVADSLAPTKAPEEPGVKVESPLRDLAFALRRVDSNDAEGDEAGISLPVWPVLVGGDDLTFVCDGRLALDLTASALATFAKDPVDELGPVTASAGVAIVRSHAPFSRAYALAERLCRSAKARWKRAGASGCALDWHLGEVRPGESVTALRERQYDGGKLTARPMLLGAANTPGTWRWLDAVLLSHHGTHSFRGDLWRERRNKVKELREILRHDAQAVGRALDAWKRVDDKLQLPPNTVTGSGTPLLDAIELMDVHVPLQPGSEVEP